MEKYLGKTKLTIALNPWNATIVDYTQDHYMIQSGDDFYFVFFPPSFNEDLEKDILSTFKILNLPESMRHHQFSIFSVTNGILNTSSQKEIWQLFYDPPSGSKKNIAKGTISISKKSKTITVFNNIPDTGRSPYCRSFKWPQDNHSLNIETSASTVILPRQNAIVVCFYGLGSLPSPIDQSFSITYQIPKALRAHLAHQVEFSRVSERNTSLPDDVSLFKPTFTRVYSIVNESGVTFTDINEIIVLDNTVTPFPFESSSSQEVVPYHTRGVSREAMLSYSSAPSSSSSYVVPETGYVPPTHPVYEHFFSMHEISKASPFLIREKGNLVLSAYNGSLPRNAFFMFETDRLTYLTAYEVSTKPVIWMRNGDIIANVSGTSPVSIQITPPPLFSSDCRKEIPVENTIYSNFVWKRDSEQGTVDSWTRVDLPDIQKSNQMLSLVVDSENHEQQSGLTRVRYRIRSFLKFPVLLCIPKENEVTTTIKTEFSLPPMIDMPWENDSRVDYHKIIVPYSDGDSFLFEVLFKPLK